MSGELTLGSVVFGTLEFLSRRGMIDQLAFYHGLKDQMVFPKMQEQPWHTIVNGIARGGLHALMARGICSFLAKDFHAAVNLMLIVDICHFAAINLKLIYNKYRSGMSINFLNVSIYG